MVHRNCPYCMSEIADYESTVSCDACEAVYHAECWEENRGCCAKGCPATRRIIRIDIADTQRRVKNTLVLTREAVESASRRPVGVLNPCVNCGKQVPLGELYCDACRPASIVEHQDAKNVGPILAMLLVLGVLLAWLIVATVPMEGVNTQEQLPQVVDRVNK
ncbi:MAG: RING finger protein [Armatimonadota bacterium]|nr:RING finger protein [Armatimonadota bacterium]